MDKGANILWYIAVSNEGIVTELELAAGDVALEEWGEPPVDVPAEEDEEDEGTEIALAHFDMY